MAKSSVSVDNLKSFVKSQLNNDQNRAANMKLLRAFGLFAGSVLLMRKFGDLMAI